MRTTIQIRGTSGSGKTWVMTQVKKKFDGLVPVYVEGRKKPLYYISKDRTTVILGHYETACGGCDTIGSAKEVYLTMLKLPNTVRYVLGEGLLLSEDTKWSREMGALRVFFLSTPLKTCLAQIENRRQAVGNVKPLNPKNTSNRIRTIERARRKLSAEGFYCYLGNPERLLTAILALLKKEGQLK